MKKTLIISTSIFVVIVVSISIIWFVNYSNLQKPLTEVIGSDPRNTDVKISVHYSKYINSKVLVFDILEVSGEKSSADIFRIFLQYAEKVNSTDFEKVELCFRGKIKYYIFGSYFKDLGANYGSENPIYTMRKFPWHLHLPNGIRAFKNMMLEEIRGSIFGSLKQEMSDYNAAMKYWFIDDL